MKSLLGWKVAGHFINPCMNTTAHGNADTLSQLPLPVVPANVQDSFVTSGQFCSWAQKDPILSKVVQFLQQG